MRIFIFFCALAVGAACGGPPKIGNNSAATGNNNSPANKSSNAVPVSLYEIVKTYPHDAKAFTQGLVFTDGVFYEGTGGKKGDDFSSSLRKVELETGKVLQKFDLAPEYFGEGIALLNGKIYQLTWREQTAFVYDVNDFRLLQQFHYSGEGWGLTDDGTNLYMSDGTHIIRVVNPENFQTVRTISVFDEKGVPVVELNELEWVKGEIWANVWQTGWIMRIDPATGKILGRIDFRQLADQEMKADERADVLNGIAYDKTGDRIFVTGKLWKHLFEIKLK